MDKIIIGNFS